ncbi:MAG: Chromosome partition protein Smc, partial [Verrucomicrobiaceae bacterium]|nr:Chromosome partition protein Smc [Verrucomicrobiaceae bacterium]
AARTREEYHAIESTIGQLRQQSQELRAQLQGAEGRIGFNRERVEELTGRIQRNEEDITNSRDLLDQHQREMEEADEQLHMIRANIEGCMTDLNTHQSGFQSLIPQRQGIDQERRAVRESIRQFDGQIAGAEARVQSLTTQISSDRQRHEMLARDKQFAAQARETAQVENDELQRYITELENTRNELDEQLKACARIITEKRGLRDTMELEFNELQRTTTQRRSRLEVIRQLLQKGEGLEQGTQQVLKGLDNPDVFLTGVRGILASHIEVAPEFITAIEAALREHLQSVLLANSDLAVQILERLANFKLGKAAVVPEDFYNTRPLVDRQALPDGAMAWAVDKVMAKNGTQKLVDQLLGHVVIAEDLQTALLIKHLNPPLAIVTLRGEFISLEGVIYGGATKEETASTLRRESEVRELAVQVEALDTQLLEKEESLAFLRMELEDAQREEAQIREETQRTREAFSQHQGKLSVVQRELQQATTKSDSIDWDQSQIGERMAAAEAQMGGLQETAAICLEQLDAARTRETELEAAADAMARRELEASEQLNELRTALALEQSALQSIERQKIPMAARLNELRGSIQRFDHEIITWRERIITAQDESEQMAVAGEEGRIRLADIEAQGAETLDRRTAAFERVTHLETQLVTLRQQNTEMSEQRSRAEVQLTRVDLRLENLVSQLQDRYQLQMESFVPDRPALLEAIENQKNPRAREKHREAYAEVEVLEVLPASDTSSGSVQSPEEEPGEVVFVADEDEVTIDTAHFEATPGTPEPTPATAAEAEPETPIDWHYVTEVVAELRQRLEGIGPVNLDAIQEFEELEQRYNFLESQHGDLVKSKAELLEVIAKINETTKNMFVETFNLVKGFFTENFRELFGAQAQADLMLVDENDPLETGIEIIAKPPGKKLQTISLLSGGERSMTAVALLFSIYQVKPSPFCVLDELDAPLDESNISRFLKMLDKFIDNSQFIIVTHNKRTMGRADVIYGVTMQEFGVSKPVGVRMTSEADVTDFARQRGIGKVVEGDPLLPPELQ